MAIQQFEDDEPPPAPRPGWVLFVVSMKRLSMLSLLALGRSTGIFFVHIFFVGLARLVPALDPSSVLTSSSIFKTWYIGIAASYLIMIPQFLWFVVPFALRYKACAVGTTLAPANALRRFWTPAFCTPDVRHAFGLAGTAMAFAGASMLLRTAEWKSSVLDPFHAGTLGVLGNLILRMPMSQWQQLLRQIEREDEGDGVWRTEEPIGRSTQTLLL
ncbi:hypothetical protein L227DRAFT_650807 [Lentinus tigrinus ALCF2SS1-6]|uniref:Uncharacterized protein n=1 Tax=Lentinus tigrinus ALCF2SS1-6 TaxID=1328759 RepID=A0A5C2SQR1_9APHY|nr:hypothetical protein L227DRAFT_650807 [Lentinus tigrinus ALCF2SS1-6]